MVRAPDFMTVLHRGHTYSCPRGVAPPAIPLLLTSNPILVQIAVTLALFLGVEARQQIVRESFESSLVHFLSPLFRILLHDDARDVRDRVQEVPIVFEPNVHEVVEVGRPRAPALDVLEGKVCYLMELTLPVRSPVVEVECYAAVRFRHLRGGRHGLPPSSVVLHVRLRRCRPSCQQWKPRRT